MDVRLAGLLLVVAPTIEWEVSGFLESIGDEEDSGNIQGNSLYPTSERLWLTRIIPVSAE